MYRWVSASGGAIPEGAVAQGHEATGESLWVCRAFLNGGLHPRARSVARLDPLWWPGS
jgi:hypothetical protein